MSITRIIKFGPSCETSEGRYQVVAVSDTDYFLAIGAIRLVLRHPLPIEPAGNVTIHRYNDVAELQRAWKTVRIRLIPVATTSQPQTCVRHGPRGLISPSPSSDASPSCGSDAHPAQGLGGRVANGGVSGR